MAAKPRKRKQSIYSLSDEPIQNPLSTLRRTPRGHRVYNDSNNIQQNFNESENLAGNHGVDYNTHSAELEETTQIRTSQLMNRTDEEDNGHDTREKNEKKTRGPTYMLDIWGRSSLMPLIKVDFDSYGRPIGTNRSNFCEFLGTIARNGTYCPLDVEDWHKMPNEYKRKMLDVVKAWFDITFGDEEWILKSINKKWRGWKGDLKARYFVENMSVENLMDEKDERVLPDQWNKLLIYWKKEDVKERSQKNSIARSKKDMDHFTGKKPFAQINANMAKEKGRPPSRAEMLDACYSSDGKTSVVVSDYLQRIEELRKELPEGAEDPVGPNDLYAQVRGPDRPGRVRMFGEGVTPSDVWGEIPNRNTSKRIMLEQRSTILNMEKQIAELQSQFLAQQRLISLGTTGSTSMTNNPPRQPSAKQSLQAGDYVALKSLFDQTKIVAKGQVHGIGTNADVGRHSLRENWCQIHISVVLQNDEQLIRPHGFCETLGDAHGELIAWPCNLVTALQSR